MSIATVCQLATVELRLAHQGRKEDTRVAMAMLQAVKSLTMSYFEPKSFERLGTRSVYEFLGVDFFKKHLILTDLLRFDLRSRRQMDIVANGRWAELRRLEWQTRRDETIHIVLNVVVAWLLIANAGRYSMTNLTIALLINLYANVYPIFVQRHNRYRLLRLFEASGMDSPYS